MGAASSCSRWENETGSELSGGPASGDGRRRIGGCDDHVTTGRLVALGAVPAQPQRLTAGAVQPPIGTASIAFVLVGEAVAPLRERAQRTVQRLALLGQHTLGAGRVLAVEAPRHDTALLELLEPVAEQVGRDAR